MANVGLSLAATAFTVYLAVGLLLFSAWSIRVWATSERPARFWPSPTPWLVWHTGAGLVWLAVLILAGGLAGLAARLAWSLAS